MAAEDIDLFMKSHHRGVRSAADSLMTGFPALLGTTAIKDLARITRSLPPAPELSSDTEYGGPDNSRKGAALAGRFTLLQLQKRGEDRGILPAVALLVVVGEIGPSEFRRGDFEKLVCSFFLLFLLLVLAAGDIKHVPFPRVTHLLV